MTMFTLDSNYYAFGAYHHHRNHDSIAANDEEGKERRFFLRG